MIIGVDASNISSGGGLTHLCELLKLIPDMYLLNNSVYIWSNDQSISKLPIREGIFLRKHRLLNKNILYRIFWQVFLLPKHARKCDILFVPGSLYLGRFKPFVTMFRNVLPFEKKVRKQYGLSKMGIRLFLLKFGQTLTFKKANGIIFLSNTSKKIISKNVNLLKIPCKIIPHGVSEIFFLEPRKQLPFELFNKEKRIKIVYVSPIDFYKNQINVAYAAKLLINKGYPITFEFAGYYYDAALKLFNKVLSIVEPISDSIKYIGPIPYNDLPGYYAKTDIFVFASSCETFGQILLEAMASGLPIVCSNQSAMPEILKDAGLYFDPEKIEDIANAIERLIINQKLREELSLKAYNYAKEYSWTKCAEETLDFIGNVATNYAENQRKK